MKRVFLIIIFISSIGSFSQDAKVLLNEVAKITRSYEDIFIEFTHKLDNTAADLHQETSGAVSLKGDFYRFNYMGVERFFDGKKVYTIIHEDEEVVITTPSKNEEDELITPSNILTFYESGFTYTMDITQNVRGKKIQYVKLTPMDSESELKNILIGIDSKTNHIHNVIQSGIDDTITTITVLKMETNQSVSDQLFTFDENKYKANGFYISEPK